MISRKNSLQYLGLGLLAAIIAGILSVATASSASAHNGAGSATCSGVTIHADSYDPNVANVWSVTINGETQTGTFGASFDQTFPVPQGGTTTTWSTNVHAQDGSYNYSNEGTVGPCGTVPVEPPPTNPTPPHHSTPPTHHTTTPAHQEVGVLPNTGGSYLWWTPVAVILIAAGGYLVYRGRKNTA